MHAKILVIEDQADINALIAINLRTLDYTVICEHDGKKGLRCAMDETYDLIILDLMLPSIDGLKVCQTLREQQIYTPILMLTAKKSEHDRVIGLDVGADDYLTKPFSVLELQARVKALLRRMALNKQQEEDEDLLSFDKLKIDKLKRLVMVANTPLNLTAKEFDLLLYLASYPGQVFSREQLLNAVWGYQHSGYEHTVNSHINRLRSKLESDPANPQYVMTVWGVGYKFNGS